MKEREKIIQIEKILITFRLFTTRVPIIRFMAREQMKPLYEKADMMDHIYDGLNALSSTPWKVRKRILSH